ncbi:MAG: class I lanthipeptide [Candidatus Aminicenantes bacterium]|nr:MAG: class I lanthipeptide [Candidatus Aminicenantes bacterium]
MKTKKFNKKLTLNKITIASLSYDEMRGLNAGAQSDKYYVCTVGSICTAVGKCKCTYRFWSAHIPC